MNQSIYNLIRGNVMLLTRYLHLDEFPIVNRQLKENNVAAISFWVNTCILRRMVARGRREVGGEIA